MFAELCRPLLDRSLIVTSALCTELIRKATFLSQEVCVRVYVVVVVFLKYVFVLRLCLCLRNYAGLPPLCLACADGCDLEVSPG